MARLFDLPHDFLNELAYKYRQGVRFQHSSGRLRCLDYDQWENVVEFFNEDPQPPAWEVKNMMRKLYKESKVKRLSEVSSRRFKQMSKRTVNRYYNILVAERAELKKLQRTVPPILMLILN